MTYKVLVDGTERMLASTLSHDEFRDFYKRLGEWETLHCVSRISSRLLPIKGRKM